MRPNPAFNRTLPACVLRHTPAAPLTWLVRPRHGAARRAREDDPLWLRVRVRSRAGCRKLRHLVSCQSLLLSRCRSHSRRTVWVACASLRRYLLGASLPLALVGALMQICFPYATDAA